MLGLSPALFKSLVSISIPLQGDFAREQINKLRIALEQIYKLRIALEQIYKLRIALEQIYELQIARSNYINYGLLLSKLTNKKIYFGLDLKCVFSRVLLIVVRFKIRHLRPTLILI